MRTKKKLWRLRGYASEGLFSTGEWDLVLHSWRSYASRGAVPGVYPHPEFLPCYMFSFLSNGHEVRPVVSFGSRRARSGWKTCSGTYWRGLDGVLIRQAFRPDEGQGAPDVVKMGSMPMSRFLLWIDMLTCSLKYSRKDEKTLEHFLLPCSLIGVWLQKYGQQ